MAFFNKKEEVIDLQLTQYGKFLLSKGEFIPEFYAFFDDGIIYDGKYAGLIEDQNSVEDRIGESPSLKTQSIFRGIETRFNEFVESVHDKSENLYDKKRKLERLKNPYYQSLDLQQDIREKFNSLKYNIATADQIGKKLPRFEVYPHRCEFNADQTMTYFTGSGGTLPIPQIACETRYELDVVTAVSVPGSGVVNNDYHYANILDQSLTSKEIFFIDGMKVVVTGDGIALEFIEENVPFQKENFELEIFEVLPSGRKSGGQGVDPTKEESLIPMIFNIDVDSTQKYVNNYFIVDRDGEISKDIIMNKKSTVNKNMFEPRPTEEKMSGVLDTYNIIDFDELVEDCDPEEEE